MQDEQESGLAEVIGLDGSAVEVAQQQEEELEGSPRTGKGKAGGGGQRIFVTDNHLSITHTYKLRLGSVVICRRNGNESIYAYGVVDKGDGEGLQLRTLARLNDGKWEQAKARKRLNWLGSNPPCVLHSLEDVRSVLSPELHATLVEGFARFAEEAAQARVKLEEDQKMEKVDMEAKLGAEFASLPKAKLAALRDLAALSEENLNAIMSVVREAVNR